VAYGIKHGRSIGYCIGSDWLRHCDRIVIFVDASWGHSYDFSEDVIMELSAKLVAGLVFALLACGGAVGQFFLWRENSCASMQDATQYYQDHKVDVNNYIHGIEFPKIYAENHRIALHEPVDLLAWAHAEDAQDGDISDRINVYGTVDNTTRGAYEVHYSVRNSYGLKATKKIKVVVD